MTTDYLNYGPSVNIFASDFGVESENLKRQVLEQGTEIETLKRTIERSESTSDVQTKAIESKSETIKSLQEQ